MKKSLKLKLILSYLAVALVTVLIVFALIRLTSGQFMMNLVVEEQTAWITDALTTYYETNHTVEGFNDYYNQLNHHFPGSIPPEGINTPPSSNDLRGVTGLVDTSYRALVPLFGYNVGEVVSQDKIQHAVPVNVDGETIAYILPDTKFQFKLSVEEQVFLQRTTLATGLAALVGVAFAVSMGIVFAGKLLKPIFKLQKASQALAAGDLQQQVTPSSQDEIGQLIQAFNQMSTDLHRADQQRKRLTADITHDLSTPLQIISGYIEMLEEGEVTLTPQRLEIIRTEIGHLRRLVDDLGILTQVEAGGLEIQFQPVQPAFLLQQTYQAYQPIAAHQGIEMEMALSEDRPEIMADEGRMLQVIKNLVDNAMRYTPKGGKITLGMRRQETRINIYVKDTGIGIAAEDLPYVFDRFYRADQSRGGSSGKMGLGLAICKALVTAQNGEISAYSATGEPGTTMNMYFDPIQ